MVCPIPRASLYLLFSWFLASPALADCLDLNKVSVGNSGSYWDQQNQCNDGSSYALISQKTVFSLLDAYSERKYSQGSPEHFMLTELKRSLSNPARPFVAIRIQNPDSDLYDDNECHIYPVHPKDMRVESTDTSKLRGLIAPGNFQWPDTCNSEKSSLASLIFLESELAGLAQKYPNANLTGWAFQIAAITASSGKFDGAEIEADFRDSYNKFKNINQTNGTAGAIRIYSMDDFSDAYPEILNSLGIENDGWRSATIVKGSTGEVLGQFSRFEAGIENTPRSDTKPSIMAAWSSEKAARDVANHFGMDADRNFYIANRGESQILALKSPLGLEKQNELEKIGEVLSKVLLYSHLYQFDFDDVPVLELLAKLRSSPEGSTPTDD